MWLVVPILAVLIILGVVVLIVALRKSKEETAKATNFRVFYNMGIIFLPVGIIFMIFSLTSDFSFAIAIPFIGIGASYIAIGLANRDKWEKQS
jgi:uncharacterized membrane protein